MRDILRWILGWFSGGAPPHVATIFDTGEIYFPADSGEIYFPAESGEIYFSNTEGLLNDS